MEEFIEHVESAKNPIVAFVFGLALTLILSSCTLERVEPTSIPTSPPTDVYETGLEPLGFSTLNPTVEQVLPPATFVAPTQEQ
jgi:hypothetical protein